MTPNMQAGLFREGQAQSSGAKFSDCNKYRYALWRIWDYEGDASCMMSIGLNPSTADATKNDPTIRRDIAFAKRLGFGGLYKLNLYGFKATQPIDMVQSDDPIGPGNDEAFSYYRTRVGLVVAGWGALDVRYRPRVQWQTRIKAVLNLLACPVYCLGITKDGSPRHPLYVKGDKELEIFWTP